MIFVDTSAWFASIVPWDADHFAAVAWFANCREHFMTTDYILDETLTLLRAKGESGRAITLGSQFFGGVVAHVHRITDEELSASWDIFRRFSDKEWSFTDCTSKVVIENHSITNAFVFDHHFSQFGTVSVVPN